MKDTMFSPSFGNRPRQIVGRSQTLAALLGSLESAPGSKERATLLLGQRGSGKTVLLWELADRARERGYVVASPTVVSETMLERIIEKVQDDGERFVKNSRSRIVGGSVGVFGFSAGLQFDADTRDSKSFAYKLEKIAQRLGQEGHGLLILVDELQANSPELRQLVISYQELVGAGQDVALVMAGLPGAVSSVLNDRVLTFLNRATKTNLGPLPLGDIDAFFARAFEQEGLDLSDELRAEATRATEGSPYLMQLIGHNLVKYSDKESPVTPRAMSNALRTARLTYEEDVCETTLTALSGRDVDFLQAMALDEGPSRIADIASRMGVTDDYAQKYRKRLISSGIIEPARRGYVQFAVPLLGDYLKRSV